LNTQQKTAKKLKTQQQTYKTATEKDSTRTENIQESYAKQTQTNLPQNKKPDTKRHTQQKNDSNKIL
jgi:hypothetical protein